MNATRSPLILPMLVLIGDVTPALAARTTLRPGPGPAAPPTAEFRGMWITRFEWPDPDEMRCKARIDRILTALAQNNFNAALFQVRGQADTLYPSPDEPWSPIISPGGRSPGWDPMEFAVDAAHKRALEFHAYINTHTAWQDNRRQPPAARSHLFYQHCNAADPNACDWLVHDDQGRPVQWGSDNYVWLAPGVPAAQAYIRNQVMYVVRHYDVDGVHLDRIRTAGAAFSHDPISVARQRPGSEGNPANLDFAEWTRDQFTRMLGDLYAQIAEAKPRVKVSATPVGLSRQDRYPGYPDSFLYGYSKCYQDAQAWMAAGVVDFIVPQIYWGEGGKPPDFSRVLPDWIAHSAERHVYAGLSCRMTGSELTHQVRETRRQGGQGAVFFSFGSFDSKGFLRILNRSGGVYEAKAPLPSMRWKEAPEEGIILGTVLDAGNAKAVVDAQVLRTNSEYVALSSGDGLYSFLQVSPGTYTLTIRKQSYNAQSIEGVKVNAGQVVRVNAALLRRTATQLLVSGESTAESQPAALAEASDRPPAGNFDTRLEGPPSNQGHMRTRVWIGLLLLVAGLSAVVVIAVFWRRPCPEA